MNTDRMAVAIEAMTVMKEVLEQTEGSDFKTAARGTLWEHLGFADDEVLVAFLLVTPESARDERFWRLFSWIAKKRLTCEVTGRPNMKEVIRISMFLALSDKERSDLLAEHLDKQIQEGKDGR